MLLALAAILSIYAAIGVALAKAAPQPPELVVGELSIQQEADRMAAWLSATLRAEVKPRRIVVTDNLFARENTGEYYAEENLIKVRPWVEEAIRFRMAGDAWRGLDDLPGPTVLLHELLHDRRTLSCWRPAPGEIDIEEGVVDAVTSDLLPAWAWVHWRARGMAVPNYTTEVAAIRAASARATGSTSWRARAARSWRYRLWGASCEGRAVMLAEVGR